MKTKQVNWILINKVFQPWLCVIQSYGMLI